MGIRGLVGNLSLQRRLHALAVLSGSTTHMQNDESGDLVGPNEVLRGRVSTRNRLHFSSIVMPYFPKFSDYIPHMPLRASGHLRATGLVSSCSAAVAALWALPVLEVELSHTEDNAWNSRRRQVQRDLLGIDAALQRQRDAGGPWKWVATGIAEEERPGGSSMAFRATEVFPLLFEVWVLCEFPLS
jgi:hypothetical protein